MARTVPAVAARGADRPLHGSVIAEYHLHGGREPARRRLADPFALAAEGLLEGAGRFELHADPGRDQAHGFDGAPVRCRQQLLAHPVAAQQQFAPVQRLERLRNPLGGRLRGAIDAAIGVDRGPDGGCAEA
ncbi:hypothetical protein ABIF15_008000 [Bradyrhizobium elkanii]